MKYWGMLNSHYPQNTPPPGGGGGWSEDVRLSFPCRSPQETIGYSSLFFKLPLIFHDAFKLPPPPNCCQASENNNLNIMAHRIDRHPHHSSPVSHSNGSRGSLGSDCLLSYTARRKQDTWFVSWKNEELQMWSHEMMWRYQQYVWCYNISVYSKLRGFLPRTGDVKVHCINSLNREAGVNNI
jgi:hypothetical protein